MTASRTHRVTSEERLALRRGTEGQRAVARSPPDHPTSFAYYATHLDPPDFWCRNTSKSTTLRLYPC